MYYTLISLILIFFVLILIYFVFLAVLSLRYKALVKLLQENNSNIKTPMEAMIGYFPNHHKEIKKTKVLIEYTASKSANENVIITYGKVKSIRRIIKAHVGIMLLVIAIFAYLVVQVHSA